MKQLSDGTKVPDDVAYFVMAYRNLVLENNWIEKFGEFTSIYELNKEQFLEVYNDAYNFFKQYGEGKLMALSFI